MELSAQRVAERVRRGRRPVSENKICQRYDRLWEHVRAAIKLAEATDVFDNSRADRPFRLCAAYANGASVAPPI